MTHDISTVLASAEDDKLNVLMVWRRRSTRSGLPHRHGAGRQTRATAWHSLSRSHHLGAVGRTGLLGRSSTLQMQQAPSESGTASK